MAQQHGLLDCCCSFAAIAAERLASAAHTQPKLTQHPQKVFHKISFTIWELIFYLQCSLCLQTQAETAIYSFFSSLQLCGLSCYRQNNFQKINTFQNQNIYSGSKCFSFRGFSPLWPSCSHFVACPFQLHVAEGFSSCNMQTDQSKMASQQHGTMRTCDYSAQLITWSHLTLKHPIFEPKLWVCSLILQCIYLVPLRH